MKYICLRNKNHCQFHPNCSLQNVLNNHIFYFQAHIYFAGTLFILLAIYCSVNVCRLHTFSRLFSRGYFLSLNVCMILIGLVRGLFLLFDPYNEGQSLPSPLAYMLLNVGYPCITSAFAILFLALLRVTQVT